MNVAMQKFTKKSITQTFSDSSSVVGLFGPFFVTSKFLRSSQKSWDNSIHPFIFCTFGTLGYNWYNSVDLVQCNECTFGTMQ